MQGFIDAFNDFGEVAVRIGDFASIILFFFILLFTFFY